MVRVRRVFRAPAFLAADYTRKPRSALILYAVSYADVVDAPRKLSRRGRLRFPPPRYRHEKSPHDGGRGSATEERRQWALLLFVKHTELPCQCRAVHPVVIARNSRRAYAVGMKPKPDFAMLKIEADVERIMTLTGPVLGMLDAACEVGGICPVHARFELMTSLCVELGMYGWTPDEISEHAADAVKMGNAMPDDDDDDESDEDDDLSSF